MGKKLPLQVRVSKDEKQIIALLAQETGCSVSEYVRKSALRKHTSENNIALQQRIIPQLCELSELIKLVSDPDVRSKLKNWRHTVWSILK